MRRLSVLRAVPDAVDQIVIASPCSVPWDSMRGDRGDARVRFCGQCRQNVYNIQELSRGEARRLIANREGRVCVRILRRDDGTVVTADCWSRLRAARRGGIVPFVAMLFVVGWAQLWAMRFGWQWLRDDGLPPVSTRETGLRMAGKMASPPGGFGLMGAPMPAPPPAEELGDVGKPSPIAAGRVRRR